MKKIKFLSCEYNMYFAGVQNLKFLSFVNYFLRLHFEKRSINSNLYEWLKPEILLLGPEPGEGPTKEFLNNLCNQLIEENVNILGVSVYVWNRTTFNIICKEIKSKLPNIIIIGGGPELDAHKDLDFFKKHPWYDYVVYGDGEKSFTNLLDYLSGNEINLINVVTKEKIYPHEIFNDKEMLSQSPYITYKNEIKEVVEKYKNDYFTKFKRKQKLVLVWETTKGCPYKCSFCDWSSGLHNKVRFWGKIEKNTNTEIIKPNYQQELDFFTELKVHMIMWSNPNVGLSPMDEEIVDYWCNLKKTNPATPISFVVQLSKIKKDVSHRLFKKMISSGLENRLKFDLQDLDPVVLNNIDRPEIPWEEHKAMIKEMCEEFPVQLGNFTSKINFIWGLPGQTLNHFDFNLTESTNLGFRTNFFYFEMLPNSPANNAEYIEKFKIKTEKIYVSHIQVPEFITKITQEVLDNYFTETNLITSCYSLSRKEWFTGVVKNYIYNYYFFSAMDKKLDKFFNNFYI